MKNKVKVKNGSTNKTLIKEIPKPLMKENLKILLAEIISDSAEFSHYDFAHWCYQHFISILQKDADLNVLGIENEVYKVIADVDAQWEMFVTTTVPLGELISTDFSKLKLPKQWFIDWYNQL